jgi:hypothetical protein
MASTPQSEAGVDAGLRQEIPGETMAGIVDCEGGAVEIAGTEEPDQAVAQVLLLQQKEDREDDDDSDGLDRFHDGHEQGLRHQKRGGWRRLHGHGQRLSGACVGRNGRCCRRAGMMSCERRNGSEMAHHRRNAIADEASDRVEFLHHGGFVLRQVACEVGDLGADQRADEENDRQRQQHGEEHRRHLRQMDPAEQTDDGPEDEAQQHRQRNRDQDRLRKVECRDDDDGHEQHEQSLGPRHLARRHSGAARQRYRLGRFRHGISLAPIAEMLSPERI